MLTKDLLCFKTDRGKIFPKLIDPQAPKFLEVAEKLIAAFSGSVGAVREILEERSKEILDSFSAGTSGAGKAIVGRGLEKLLLDRTEFDTEPNTELAELREKVFRNSAALLRESENETARENGELETYQHKITQEFNNSPEDLGRQLYGDLPPFQEILGFRKMSGEGLLHRYNCAQVQGLLLRCESMTVRLPDSRAAHLRQLLKHLRFHQLLTRLSHDSRNKKILVLEIDGPLSLFVQTQKYGFNLANFFPAILHQPAWELEAEVRMRKNQTHTLLLNQSCGIRSYYRQFLAYVPDEIQLFSRQLAEKLTDWELTPAADFVALSGETLCFPDFWLTHRSGVRVALELFHKWHAAPLRQRLEQLKARNDAPLLLGLNRGLLKDQLLAEQIETSGYFSNYGFFFRETPTATVLCALLKVWLKRKADTKGL